MTDLSALLERLVKKWQSQGLEVGPALTESGVAAFEREHVLSLPADVRQYFLRVNGMSRSNGSWPVDMHEISFYPLTELALDTSATGQPGPRFVFADFLISAHDYVIDLSFATERRGKVFAVGGRTVQLGIDFDVFLDRYLCDDPDVLQPWRGIQSEGERPGT